MDVGENEPPTSSQAAHPTGYRVDRFGLQIIRNAVPDHDGRLGRVEPRLYQTERRHLLIEVNRYEVHMCKVGT
jgi:hypothetical protein